MVLGVLYSPRQVKPLGKNGLRREIILLGMFSVCFSPPALVGRPVIMDTKSTYLYPSGSAVFYVSESHTDKWIHYRLSTSNKTP